MQKSVEEVFQNKSFTSFFKRGVLFIGLLIFEILILTLYLDFSPVNFGTAFISTHAHLTIYLFLVLFLILAHHRLLSIHQPRIFNWKVFGYYAAANLICVISFYYFSDYITSNASLVKQSPLTYTIVWWILGLTVPLSLLFGIFDLDYVTYFARKFKKSIAISSLLSVVFLAILNYSIKFWPYFSRIVAEMVYWMLSVFFKGAIFRMEGSIPIVGIPAVAAKIYAPCSGMEGMGLFLLLFTVLAFVEYDSLNLKKLIILFPLGVLGAFTVNVLRTFSIFVIGHFTSAEFAIGAFHSNVGWVFFTLYFLGFIYFVYPWMRK